jgi:hypothetical protein
VRDAWQGREDDERGERDRGEARKDRGLLESERQVFCDRETR